MNIMLDKTVSIVLHLRHKWRDGTKHRPIKFNICINILLFRVNSLLYDFVVFGAPNLIPSNPFGRSAYANELLKNNLLYDNISVLLEKLNLEIKYLFFFSYRSE